MARHETTRSAEIGAEIGADPHHPVPRRRVSRPTVEELAMTARSQAIEALAEALEPTDWPDPEVVEDGRDWANWIVAAIDAHPEAKAALFRWLHGGWTRREFTYDATQPATEVPGRRRLRQREETP